MHVMQLVHGLELLLLLFLLHCPQQMLEHTAGVFVAHVLSMDAQFLYRVGVEVAGVAAQLDGGVGCVRKFVFVAWTALFDVIDKVQLLDVFVSFAVQLEVGLEIGFVVA